MKARVIIEDKKFVPQMKKHWWSNWMPFIEHTGIYPYPIAAETLEQAVEYIEKYVALKKDNGKVVWEKTYDR